MIFFVLNVLLAAALFGLSFIAELGESNTKNKSFISMLLVQSAAALSAALCALALQIGQQKLALSFIRFFIWFSSVQSVLIFLWCCRYPYVQDSPVQRIFFAAVAVASFYAVFFVPESVYFDAAGRLTVVSGAVGFLPVEKFTAYKAVFIYFVPVLTILVLLFKYELLSHRLLRRRILGFAGTLCIGGVLFLLIRTAVYTAQQYRFIFLFSFVYAFVLFLFYLIQRSSLLINAAAFLRLAGIVCITYILPAVCAALVFAFLLPLAQKNVPLFFLCAAVSTAALFLSAFEAGRRAFAADRRNDSFYAERMEKEFAGLDFGDIDTQIDARFARILQSNIHTSNVIILTENDEHRLVTRYSLNGVQTEFDVDNPIFSSLLNMQRRIVFKAHCETVHELSPIASKLNAMFEQTGCAVMILLNEGVHLFGLILLGEREQGRSYTDYDYETLSALYSRFFLTGYYLRNIANKELIGLVGREINFSS